MRNRTPRTGKGRSKERQGMATVLRRGAYTETKPTLETRVGQRIEVLASGCWAYNGKLDRYARVNPDHTAHRFVYETLIGEIPEGWHLHHNCENPGCCNPDHLEPMTPSEHKRWHQDRRSHA